VELLFVMAIISIMAGFAIAKQQEHFSKYGSYLSTTQGPIAVQNGNKSKAEIPVDAGKAT